MVKLTIDTFNTTIAQNEFVFVEFYSPRCRHCVKFAPYFDELASYYQKEGKGMVVAAVDLSEEGELTEQEDIKAYPTLKLYVRGDSIEYDSDRNIEDIMEWIDNIRNAKIPAIANP